jgi:hypothetical protein
MKWNPELQPRDNAEPRETKEWLVRSFRKISEWSRIVVKSGYGGIYLSAPTTLTTPVNLTTSFQKILGFDTALPSQGIEVDLPGDRIRVVDSGKWLLNFSAVGEIVPFSTNVAQTIEVAAYNETKAVSHIVGYHPVPRYTDVFDVSLSGQRPIPFGTPTGTDTGDWVSLWIRQRNATPAITINTLQELEISGSRAG